MQQDIVIRSIILLVEISAVEDAVVSFLGVFLPLFVCKNAQNEAWRGTCDKLLDVMYSY